LDEFKKRPEIKRVIAGGQTVEYSAHVIPEGGLKAMGRLYCDGLLVVGDAAGFALNIGVTVRGMEYALASGYFAAQAIMKAKETGDYSAAALKRYAYMLETSFLMKDFRNFAETPAALDNPRFFQYYPRMVGDLAKDIYGVSAGPKATVFQTLRNHFKLADIWPMLRDLRRVVKI
jgi:electron transfer flavoprotein-quinone oxidoreductase